MHGQQNIKKSNKSLHQLLYPVGLFITDMLYILYTLPIIKNKFW